MARKIILYMSVSLDGYMEGPDRSIDWHTVDAELHRHFNEELAAAGGFIDGRVTYELMQDFWPTADKDPASTPEMVEFAEIWRTKPKIVYSTTLEHADGDTTIVRSVDPDEVRALKEEPGGDLALGGADLAAAFAEHDLIDGYHLCVHPVLLGRGKPLFPGTDTPTSLRLVGTRTFGTGVVLLRYERDR
ncbi:dihydrofolate reductase family protein [Streptomyces sp. NPDC053755]|uniref:dihydrofolate reductase family protein n=1 Tax=Streptomyces sp. NPDC053755 TaxID=3155815 RepID=UPI00341CC4B4